MTVAAKTNTLTATEQGKAEALWEREHLLEDESNNENNLVIKCGEEVA